MSAYRKGYVAEREIMRLFEDSYDCFCIRSAGSHTSIDVVAGNGKEVYAIQVKSGLRERKFNWKRLVEDAIKLNAIPIYAYKIPFKGWLIDKVLSNGIMIPLRE